MKKLYLKFKALDFTKRIVICFITVSLLFVVGLTTYKTINGLYNTNNASQIIEKEDKNKTANKKETTQPTNDASQETASNQPSQDSQETTVNQSSTQSAPQSSSNKQEVNNTQEKNNTQENRSNVQNQAPQSSIQEDPVKQETTPKCNVNLTIKGYQGKIMASQSVNLEEGSSVYNALKEVCLQKGMSVKGTSSYIKGIGGVCEFDHGSGSGWMYYVNGVQPNKSCGSYILKNGDQVIWEYVNYE